MIRYVLEDLDESFCQRAVVSNFRDELIGRGYVVVLASELDAGLISNVTDRVAKRLLARCTALEYSERFDFSVFVPGYLIPLRLSHQKFDDYFQGGDISSEAFYSVGSLDFFIARNRSQGLLDFNKLISNKYLDYDLVSSYRGLQCDFYFYSGIKDGRDINLARQPWNSSTSGSFANWGGCLLSLLESGKLTKEMVELDVSNGSVRPSLLADLEALSNSEGCQYSYREYPIDGIFDIKDVRVSKERLTLLPKVIAKRRRDLSYQRRIIELLSIKKLPSRIYKLARQAILNFKKLPSRIYNMFKI